MERFLDYFVPEKYVLDLGINKFDKKIGGVVEIVGKAKEEVVKFHAVGLNVKQVFVGDTEVKFEVKDDTLTVFDVPISEVTITISYLGTLNENM